MMELLDMLSLLTLSIVGVCGESWKFLMEGDVNFNNYACRPGEYAFELFTTRNEIECAYHCGVDDTCKSMFYVPGTTRGTCYGCTTRYKSTDIATLGILQESLYYASTFDFAWADSGYIFIDTEQDFTSGTSLCNGLGGYPVAIETEAENEFIVARLEERNIDGAIYVGLQQLGGAGTDWIWQGTGQVMTYNGFLPPEPNNGYEKCVAMLTLWGFNYKWADIPCSGKPRTMLCEMNI